MEDSELFWAWLAGFIDGEGSLIVGLCVKKTHSHRWNLHLNVYLTIPQHERGKHLLEEIHKTIGGGTLYAKGKRDAHMWRYTLVERELLVQIVTRLQPYLRLKNTQAALILKVLETIVESRKRKINFGLGEHRLTREEAMEIAAISVGINEGDTRNTYRQGWETLKKKVDLVYSQPMNKPKNAHVVVKCQECGTEVTRNKSQIKGSVFCGTPCYSAFQAKAKESFYTEIPCTHCKRQFKRKKSQIKPTNFCGLVCANNWAKERRTKGPSWEGPETTIH